MDATGELLRAEGVVMQRCLNTLHQRIGPRKFNAWFKHGTLLSIEDERVRVAVPNPFVANWIETHYQADIATVVAEHTGRKREVVVTIDPALTLTSQPRQRQLDTQADIVNKANQGRARPRQAARPGPIRYKLDDFVVGSSNKLAYSAAIALTDNHAPFSHLFIHGPCGVGKTHLLQGICNTVAQAKQNGSPFAWRYVTAEQFTNEFITAVRKKRTSQFHDRYRRLQLLAIDDVHFLAAKKATQEEFLHTFNTLASAGNRIALASDAHPRLVGELNEQLVSRFVAGMVVKIAPPDESTRMEILHRRAESMKLRVSDDVLGYIALHIRGSVRELEGALIKLAAVSALSQEPVTLAMVTDALADHLARTGSVLTLGDIEATVAAFFGITPADIHSSRRTRTVSTARMITMFLARRHTPMSYPEIGRFMGKNHSSVVLAVQRMEKLLGAGGELKWMTPMGAKSMRGEKLVQLLSEQIS